MSAKFFRQMAVYSAMVAFVGVGVATATVVPFTEEFTTDSAAWRDNPGTGPLGWSAVGGPDGGSHATTTFNFVNQAPGGTPTLFRAQDEFGSSGNAFVGNWLADGVTEFSAFVRHEAGLPLTFFVRFSNPSNFPGAVGLNFAPVPSGVWTRIAIGITPGNPQFINFETSDFNTIFSNIGHVQIGVSVPAALAGVNAPFAFSLDKPTIVPEPAALLTLGICAAALVRGRRN